jgi:SAM-dependent methyltransferase
LHNGLEAAHWAAKRHDRVIVAEPEQLDLEACGLDVGSFDVLIYPFTLERVRNPLQLLRRQVALLRPGGRLLASLSNARSIEQLAACLDPPSKTCDPSAAFRLWRLSRRTATALLERAGLLVERTVFAGAPSSRDVSPDAKGRLALRRVAIEAVGGEEREELLSRLIVVRTVWAGSTGARIEELRASTIEGQAARTLRARRAP